MTNKEKFLGLVSKDETSTVEKAKERIENRNMEDKIKSTERCVNYEYIKADPVIEALKQKFDERSFVGIKKYKTTLHENNEDDFLVHLHEELMDACAYIMKLRIQRNK